MNPVQETTPPRPLYPDLEPPPRVSVAASARRYWYLVLIVVVLLVGTAVAVGERREPTFSAESRLSVGIFELGEPGAVASFASASSALASAYSRSIQAEDVVDSVARRLRLSPALVRERLSASPVPQSPVFRVQAESPDARQAVALANAGTNALVSYVETRSDSGTRARDIYRRYQEAALVRTRRQSRVLRLRRALNAQSTDADRDRLHRAQAALDATNLRLQVLRRRYSEAEPNRPSLGAVQILTSAQTASSDRASMMQILMLIGLVAGLAIGLALATLMGKRALLRSVRGGRL